MKYQLNVIQLKRYSALLVSSTLVCVLGTGCKTGVVESAGGNSSPSLVTGGTNFSPEPGGAEVSSTGGTLSVGDGESGGTTSEEVEPAGADVAGTDVAGMDVAGMDVAGADVAGETAEGGETSGTEIGGDSLQVVCEPGERVGLCSVCDDNGELTTPTTDPECPSVECPESRYNIDADGQCLRQDLSGQSEGACLELGVCDLEAQECDVLESEVIAQGGVCQEIISCDGEELPEIENRPNGALCNEWGTCQDGECSASPDCAAFERYNNRNFYCGAGQTEEGGPVCGFYVSGLGANNNGRITCTEFCERSGSTCVDGWNNDNDVNCDQGNGDTGCDVSYQTQICVCTAL